MRVRAVAENADTYIALGNCEEIRDTRNFKTQCSRCLFKEINGRQAVNQERTVLLSSHRNWCGQYVLHRVHMRVRVEILA